MGQKMDHKSLSTQIGRGCPAREVAATQQEHFEEQKVFCVSRNFGRAGNSDRSIVEDMQNGFDLVGTTEGGARLSTCSSHRPRPEAARLQEQRRHLSLHRVWR